MYVYDIQFYYYIFYLSMYCTLKIRLPGTSRSHLTSLLSHLIGFVIICIDFGSCFMVLVSSLSVCILYVFHELEKKQIMEKYDLHSYDNKASRWWIQFRSIQKHGCQRLQTLRFKRRGLHRKKLWITWENYQGIQTIYLNQ